jgi:hypothetical protein
MGIAHRPKAKFEQSGKVDILCNPHSRVTGADPTRKVSIWHCTWTTEVMSQDRAKEQVYLRLVYSPVERVFWAIRAKISPPVEPAQVGEGQERGGGAQRHRGREIPSPYQLALCQGGLCRVVVRLYAGQALLQLVASLNAVL